MSLSSVLRKRELGLLTPAATRNSCRYEDWIPLQDIGPEEILFGGHMIMGFTADGHYIMSYQKIVHGYESLYSLHFWKFNFRKTLVKVHSVPLFASVFLNQFLKLRISIHQTEGGLISVVGKCKSLYISVLPAPPSVSSCKQCLVKHQHLCLCHSFVLHCHLPNPASSTPITNEVIAPAADTFVFRSAVSLVAIQVAAKPSAQSASPCAQELPRCCASAVSEKPTSCDDDGDDLPSESSPRPSAGKLDCPVPVVHCKAPHADAGRCCSASSSSSLLSGQVQCYTANPEALVNGENEEAADYDTLALRVLHLNGVPLLCLGETPPATDSSACEKFIQVAQHTVDLEEYIHYAMVHHPATVDRFRGVSDYALSVHVWGNVVIGSLAIIVERWDDDDDKQVELSPFDFDYVPGNPLRTRASSNYEGLIVFEWSVDEGLLRTIDVTLYPNHLWLKVAESGSSDLVKFFACRMHLRSELSLCDVIKISKLNEPPAMSNKDWFLRSKSVTHFKHPSLPVYVYLRK